MSRRDEERLRLPGLWRVYCVFGRHYRPYTRVLLGAGLALLGTVAMEAMVPWPLKLILDHVVLGRHLPHRFQFLAALLKLLGSLLELALAAFQDTLPLDLGLLLLFQVGLTLLQPAFLVADRRDDPFRVSAEAAGPGGPGWPSSTSPTPLCRRSGLHGRRLAS